jgi:hypothetical protein
MIKLIAVSLALVGCGMEVEVEDSQHDVNMRDSTQTVQVTTTMDTILEVCGIVLADGTVVPYSEWTEAQDECLNKLSNSTVVPNLGGLDEETIQNTSRS